MSGVQKMNEQPVDNADNDSSSLDYLANNVGDAEELQGSNQEEQVKKRGRSWVEKDTEIRKVYINNRTRQKKVQNDSQYEGVYLYKPGVQLPSLYQFANQTIKIIVATEYIKKHNPQLLKRNIYGTDPYTSNSDAVCMLVHSGLLNLNNFMNKRCEGVELICKVSKPKKNYAGGFKNGLMTRSLKGYNGNALKPESVKNLQSLGPMESLERYAANMHIPIGKQRVKSKPKNISNIVPIPQTHIVFNMNNEPAYKYSIFNIADKGFEKSDFLIKKLENSVLYLQTETGEKYELLKSTQLFYKDMEMETFEVFKLSKVKNADRIDNAFFKAKPSPLDSEYIDVVRDNLEWQDIVWGNCSIILRADKSDPQFTDSKIDRLASFKYYRKEETK